MRHVLWVVLSALAIVSTCGAQVMVVPGSAITIDPTPTHPDLMFPPLSRLCLINGQQQVCPPAPQAAACLIGTRRCSHPRPPAAIKVPLKAVLD